MSFWYVPGGSSNIGKLSLATGAVACAAPLLLFGLHLPQLPSLERNVLTGIFMTSMAVCSFVGYKRPWFGLVVGPVLFFAAMCLGCWWVVSR
jgi:hypothetical protein